MKAYKRITVIVTPEEYDSIKAKAGLVPLSAWFRYLALPPEPPESRAAQALEKGFTPCKHGLRFCKKCA